MLYDDSIWCYMMIQYDSIWWCYMMMLWMGLWWFVNFFSACLETDWSNWGWIAYPVSSSADANGVQITTGSSELWEKTNLTCESLWISKSPKIIQQLWQQLWQFKMWTKSLEFWCGIAVSPPAFHLAQALCRKGLLHTKVGSCLARFR